MCRTDPASNRITSAVLLLMFLFLAEQVTGFEEAPKTATAFVNRGNTFYVKQKYDEAIADYTEAIRLDPKYSAAFSNRGLSYTAKGEYDKAIVDATEAIRLDPLDAHSFNTRGNAYYGKGENEKAIEDLTEAIRLDGKYTEAFIKRANAYVRLRNDDKAIADYTEAIRLNPKYAKAFYNRGDAYDHKKEYDKAIADYTEVIRLNPKYGSAFNQIAWLLATCPKDRIRDGKKAVEHAMKACELSEWKHSGRIGTLAAAYAEKGDFKEAVKWQKRAIELGFNGKDDLEDARKYLKLYEEGKPLKKP